MKEIKQSLETIQMNFLLEYKSTIILEPSGMTLEKALQMKRKPILLRLEI